ncbi:MAG: D-Ala-D-Ala carboxypeptidase family metallohydrolase [Lewinella sp.]
MSTRKWLLITVLLLFLATVSCYLIPTLRFDMEQMFFRITTNDQPVTTEEDIDQILSKFAVIDQADLPTDFLLRTQIDAPEFRQLSPRKFFVIRKKDLYRKVVGHLRIHQLFAVGAPERNGFYLSGDPLYWGVDPDILHKLLELRLLLESEGFDGAAFHCNYGYRHPTLNATVGGASRSRHIAGDAVDLVIEDINQDGQANTADKAIVLDLCERQLIGNLGGIGRYPGTQVVHIDLRGTRARWDSY